MCGERVQGIRVSVLNRTTHTIVYYLSHKASPRTGIPTATPSRPLPISRFAFPYHRRLLRPAIRRTYPLRAGAGRAWGVAEWGEGQSHRQAVRQSGLGAGLGWVARGRPTSLPFQLDQSKSMVPHPFVEDGSVGPVPLQGMMRVDRFICHTGGPFGTCATATEDRAKRIKVVYIAAVPLLRG